MKIKKVINEIIKTNRTLEIEQIEDSDFVFYKDIKIISISHDEHTETIMGVTSLKNINEVNGLNDINTIIYAPNMYDKVAQVVAIKKSNFEEVINGKKSISKVIEVINDEKFLNSDEYMLVLYNIHSCKIADLYYNFISIPIKFDYTNSLITSSNYNLNKVLKKLKADDKVVDKDNLQIKSLPYFDSMDNEKYIEFKYLFSNEDYQKISKMNMFDIMKYLANNILDINDCKILKRSLFI